MIHPEDKDIITKYSGVIYRSKCTRVECDEEYIGEFARTFEERFKEHLKASSPVYDHHKITCHLTTVNSLNIMGEGGPEPCWANQRINLNELTFTYIYSIANKFCSLYTLPLDAFTSVLFNFKNKEEWFWKLFLFRSEFYFNNFISMCK